jgi:hypothetical protein
VVRRSSVVAPALTAASLPGLGYGGGYSPDPEVIRVIERPEARDADDRPVDLSDPLDPDLPVDEDEPELAPSDEPPPDPDDEPV